MAKVVVQEEEKGKMTFTLLSFSRRSCLLSGGNLDKVTVTLGAVTFFKWTRIRRDHHLGRESKLKVMNIFKQMRTNL